MVGLGIAGGGLTKLQFDDAHYTRNVGDALGAQKRAIVESDVS